MRPLRSHEIKGNWATLLLPINQDGSIDFVRLAEEIAAIAAAGVDGVYSNGTAGEFYNQTEDEFDRISHDLATRCEMAGLAFQIGVSHMSPQISLERLRRARALRPAAFQVVLPDWFPLIDDEIHAFLDTMAAEADPVGLVLYNPPHSKRALTPETIASLAAKVPAIVGVKVAPTGDDWFQRLALPRERLSVFTPGHFLASHYPMGSSGAYSNVACLSAAGAQKWYELIKTDLPAAQAIQERLLKFFAAHITPYITEQKYANAAVDKLLAAVGGWASIGTRMRWPYRSIPQEHALRLRPIARQCVPELFPGG